MRLILTLFLIIFFNSCSKKENSEEKKPKITKEKKEKIKTIQIKDLKLSFKNNTLNYPPKKVILLFEDNNTLSKAQELVLNKLNLKYYKTDSKFLENYFKIEYYPTIIILDKNKTIKYENFTPYEILKAEGL